MRRPNLAPDATGERDVGASIGASQQVRSVAEAEVHARTHIARRRGVRRVERHGRWLARGHPQRRTLRSGHRRPPRRRIEPAGRSTSCTPISTMRMNPSPIVSPHSQLPASPPNRGTRPEQQKRARVDLVHDRTWAEAGGWGKRVGSTALVTLRERMFVSRSRFAFWRVTFCTRLGQRRSAPAAVPGAHISLRN